MKRKRKILDVSTLAALGTLFLFILAVLLYSNGFFDKKVFFDFVTGDLDECKDKPDLAQCSYPIGPYGQPPNWCLINFCIAGQCKHAVGITQVIMTSEDNYHISASAGMPRVKVRAKVVALGYDVTHLIWLFNWTFQTQSYVCKKIFSDQFSIVKTSPYNVEFPLVRGGELTAGAKYMVGGASGPDNPNGITPPCGTSINAKAIIDAYNPTKVNIDNYIDAQRLFGWGSIVKRIACVESSKRQFASSPGSPLCASGGAGTAVGIMQVNDAKRKEAYWTWYKNIDAGIDILLNIKRSEAEAFFENIRRTYPDAYYGDEELGREMIQRYGGGRYYDHWDDVNKQWVKSSNTKYYDRVMNPKLDPATCVVNP